MTENWLPIPGWEISYEASDLGRIRNRRTGKIRKPYVPKGEVHPRITLSNGRGGQVAKRVHQWVMLTWRGPCPPGKETRHLDGDPMHNAISNLVYGTKSENTRDAVEHGTHPQSRKVKCPQKHPLSGANLYVTPDGKRGCKTCRREAYRRWYNAKVKKGS